MNPHPLRRVGWLLNAALATLLVATTIRFLDQSLFALRYPYDLDYGEGIVWQQMLMIPGGQMYGDITRFPYIVFHYPPVFHLAVRVVAELGLDGLVAGRIVSIMSTLSMAGLMGAVGYRAMPAAAGLQVRWFVGFLAAALPLASPAVFLWAPLMRVDMPAMALVYAGILAGALAPGRHAWLVVSGLFFVAAVYTRQTALAAPAATFGVMLLVTPGPAIRAALVAGVTAVAILVGMSWLTDGGFLRHLVSYNINRFDLLRGLGHAFYVVLGNLALVIAALVAAVFALRELRRRAGLIQHLREDTGARLRMILIVYALLTSGMLPMLGKSGASVNYWIEWVCAVSLLAALLVGWCAAALRNLPADARPHLALLLAPALLIIQCVSTLPRAHGVAAPTPALMALEAELRADVRPAIGDVMVLMVRAGSGVVWEPAIFAELASLGRWDEAPLLAMLDRHAFAMVVTVGDRGSFPYDSRYTPTISDAIQRNYPRREVLGVLVVRRPPLAVDQRAALP